ncbi:MAG: PTPA-CTERM sorting domain-containing protein [Nodosilinea sp. WJT8-NPBG4]|nr:PTPA-CTERM sorting domain-containing protein [Nodosilinea sp. WJT8-NPBG4]
MPTPALLPGLIGMGIAAMRKKGQEEPTEQEA